MQTTHQTTKEFLKMIFSIALPIGMQSLLYSLLGIVDQVMVGQLNEVSFVAAGQAGKIFSILNFALIGVCGGLGILCAQVMGANKPEKVRDIQRIALLSGFALTMFFVVASLFFSETCMRFFTSDKAVIAQGVLYHKALAPGYVAFLFVIVYSTVLRSARIVKLPMLINVMSAVLNTFLNYLLIFGKMGAPQMGIKGAALATTISRIAEAGVLLLIVYAKKLPGAFSLRELLTIPATAQMKKMYWQLSLPLIATNISFVLADSTYAAIYGKMGIEPAAAVGIVMPIQGLVIGFFSGFSSAAAVLLGNTLGKGDNDGAFRMAKKIMVVGFVFPIAMCLLVLVGAPYYIQIFNVDASVVPLATKTLYVMLLFIPIKVVNMIACQGVLSSGGETKFLFRLSVLGMWCIGVPLGYLAAYRFSLPIYVVVGCISFEECVRLILGCHRVNKKTWLRKLVKA